MSATNLPYDRATGGKLLNIAEVRERLGDASRSFVYGLISKGELKGIRLGDIKGLRVPEKSVERYLKRREKMQIKND